MSKKHLAIFKDDLAEAILSGKKTIETRFSLNRIAPYGQVNVGDLVFIKPSGKEIKGQFRVKKVIYFEGLEEGDVDEIFAKYGKEIGADESYLVNKKTARFGTIIFIKESERLITSPIRYKKKDLRGWVVLES